MSTTLAATGILHIKKPRKQKSKDEKEDLSKPLLNDEVDDLASIGRLGDFATYDGLTDDEADRRLLGFGPNSIPRERVSLPKRIVLTYLKPMAIFLFVVGIVCAVIKDWVAFAVVMGLTTLNGLVQIYEEIQSEKAIDALRSSLGIDSTVKRSGNWIVVSADALVPGDLVKVKLGDMIPADCVLQQGRDLEVDQSVVTGESIPVFRGSGSLVYSGSLVVAGSMTAVVVGTGINSMYGKSAQLMREPKTQTNLQRFVFRIAIVITIIAMVLSLSLVIVKLVTSPIPPLIVIQRALVLLVAAVPIAMAVVITTALALGSRELASVGIITARLNAIEQLAGMEVALCDKTGTLTLNKLKLSEPWLMEGVSQPELLMFASLASSSENPDAIDKVIAESMGVTSASMSRKFELRDFVAFDPVKKRSSAVLWQKVEQREYEVVKGAPHSVADFCGFSEQLTKIVLDTVGLYASRGLRCLAVAVRVSGEPWKLLGMLSLIDALRPEASQVVHELADEGVEVKMVTGDGLEIARETCRMLGMYTNTLARRDMMRIMDSGSDDWTSQKLDEVDAFAEVFPEDKYEIVGLMQKLDHIVGMTGDGVNDCPALRRADIGIAVHGAADAARVAADIVLTRADVSVLSDAVLVSRMIFERLRNYILFRLNCTSLVLFWTFLGEVFFNFSFPAMAFVAIAMSNNFTILCIAFDFIVPERRPLRWEFSDILPVALFMAIMSTLEVFVTFSLAANGLLLFSAFLTPGQVRTIVFMNMAISMQMSVFVVRCRNFFFIPRLAPRPGFWVLLTVCTLAVSFTIIAVYWPFGGSLEPIPWNNAGQVLLIVLVFMLLKDIVKVLVYYVVAEVFPGRHKMEPKLKSVSPSNPDYVEVEMQPVANDPHQLKTLVIKH